MVRLIFLFSFVSALFLDREAKASDLAELVREVSEGVDLATNANCRETFRGLYEKLYYLGTEDVAAGYELPLATVNQASWELWETRIALDDWVKTRAVGGTLTPECYRATRNFERALRYLQDQVGLFIKRHRDFGRVGGADQVSPFVSPEMVLRDEVDPVDVMDPFILVNPVFEFEGLDDLESGDILLMVGTSPVSNLINRATSIDSQFSHVGMVYRDPATGRAYVVEALIEVGGTLHPVEDYANSKTRRMLAFRPKDRAVAARAAEFAYEKVTSRLNAGNPLRYDATANPHPENYEDGICCTTLIQWAFRVASQEIHGDAGELVLPHFLSEFDQGELGSRSVFKLMGAEHTETFAPADVLFDPNFDLVAEWKNLYDIENEWMDGMVGLAMANMELDGYQFHPNLPPSDLQRLKLWLMNQALNGAWWLRQIGFFKSKFPKYMKRDHLRAILVWSVLFYKLRKKLKRAWKDHYRRTKSEMTPREMIEELSRFRDEDAAVSPRRKSAFHWFFSKDDPTEACRRVLGI